MSKFLGLRAGVTGAVFIALTGCQSSVKIDAPAPAATRFSTDLTTLADDRFEGRETGTPGYDAAAAYVAERFAEAGLAPGGEDGGFMQAVTLRGYVLDPAAASVEIVATDGRRTPLALGEDYVPSGHPTEAVTDIKAEAVFVGYGVAAPERGRDDYVGVDLRGKIAVVLDGAPADFASEERAHYASGRVKAEAAAARGAIGLVSLETPTSERRAPFARRLESLGAQRMVRVDRAGAPIGLAPEIKATASLSMAGAAKLIPDWPAVVAAAEGEGAVTRAAALGVDLHIRARTTHAPVASANVIGVLEGADPELAKELVVLTAHLDHLGVRGEGPDRIHNGALDNAAGVAALIETARQAVAGRRAKRTLVFAAVAAEETGFGGSETFATAPSVAGRLVANVNLDMPILLYDFEDVIAFGAERSDLGKIVKAAAQRQNLKLAPDPFPEQAIFVRSDHYSFVREGVPAVMLATGWGGRGELAWKAFLANDYHRPSDEIDLGIDMEAGAKFARLNYEIARAIAEAAEAPRWRAGDFFGEIFGGPMADTSQ